MVRGVSEEVRGRVPIRRRDPCPGTFPSDSGLRLQHTTSQLRVHAVKNADPALSVPQGLQIPLTASPCHHAAGSVEPFTSADMHADPELAGLPAAKDMGATS